METEQFPADRVIYMEVWSNATKTWIHHRNFPTRAAAERSCAAWERDGYKCRVVEREFRTGPDFVNCRGE